MNQHLLLAALEKLDGKEGRAMKGSLSWDQTYQTLQSVLLASFDLADKEINAVSETCADALFEQFDQESKEKKKNKRKKT